MQMLLIKITAVTPGGVVEIQIGDMWLFDSFNNKLND